MDQEMLLNEKEQKEHLIINKKMAWTMPMGKFIQ